MKLSRYTLALCLAATIGLSVPVRQAQCQGGLDKPARMAEKSGSPSYQAAQTYEGYDCFASGCHSGYGDILPDLSRDESNVREEGLPPEPVNVDADLPGDEPSHREIPARTTQAPQPPVSFEGFTRGDAAPQMTPPRGYFSPGYPHPGYMHPNYGYSHTEPADDSEGLTEQQVAAEAAAEEALAQKAVTQSADPQFNKVAKSVLVEAWEEEGFGEDTLASEAAEEESLEEEPVAKPATEDLSQEYARYDDTYGYDSEWYGPYDATKVVPQPVAEVQEAERRETASTLPADYTLTSQYEDRSEECDPAPEFEADEEPIVDYGPAELEVDATTAVSPSADDEDAAFEAAIADSHDDWFYRETYGYGPRYDYDAYGYEDFPAAQSAGKSKPGTEPVWTILSAASKTFPWDYLYRLELGIRGLEDLPSTASVRIPYAPEMSGKSNDSDLFGLMAEADADAEAAEDDPAVPASADFDPSALISEAAEKLSQIDSQEILANIGWWSRTLTPMELARLALEATPVAKRNHLIVLIPQPKVVEIKPFQVAMDPEGALRELALMLDGAGQALQMLSRRVEAYADATSPMHATDEIGPLQSRNPASSETR
jgi:hypothetical protein